MIRRFGFLLPLFLSVVPFFMGCSCDEKKEGTKEEAVMQGAENPVASLQPEEKKFNGIKIHFKRPEGWGEPNIYAVGELGASSEEYSGPWPGSKMIPEGNDWYVYAVDNVDQATIIFNDGNRQIPRAGYPLFNAQRKRGEWWFDGSWHDTPPEDI